MVVGKALPAGFPLNRESAAQLEQELADPHGGFVTVQGRSIYYVNYSNSGPPIVLLHGFATSSASWSGAAPLLAELGYDVYALDLGGFGLSDKRWDAGYGHADQADLVADWMNEIGMGPATVIGHSMGGNVAAHLALRHPHLVERLVLECSAVLSGLDAAPQHLGRWLDVPPVRRAARLAVREVVRRTDFSPFEARNPHITRVLRTADWDQALLAIVRDSWANKLNSSQLRQIRVPTLLVWGAEDTTVPVTDVGKLQMLLPDCRAMILAGLGHLPHEEDPERFVETVLPHLATAELEQAA